MGLWDLVHMTGLFLRYAPLWLNVHACKYVVFFTQSTDSVLLWLSSWAFWYSQEATSVLFQFQNTSISNIHLYLTILMCIFGDTYWTISSLGISHWQSQVRLPTIHLLRWGPSPDPVWMQDACSPGCPFFVFSLILTEIQYIWGKESVDLTSQLIPRRFLGR